jgi:hypothetical protein
LGLSVFILKFLRFCLWGTVKLFLRRQCTPSDYTSFYLSKNMLVLAFFSYLSSPSLLTIQSGIICIIRLYFCPPCTQLSRFFTINMMLYQYELFNLWSVLFQKKNLLSVYALMGRSVLRSCCTPCEGNNLGICYVFSFSVCIREKTSFSSNI